MLIDNSGPKVGDVVTIRLVSGEEVIGVLENSTGSGIGRDAIAELTTLNKPLCVMMQMVGQSDARLQFAPFAASISDDGKVSFYKNIMLFRPVKTRDDVAQAYRRMTSSLDLPPSGLII